MNGKRNNRLLLGILAGIVTGGLAGGLYPEAGLSVKFAGDLFIRFLMMIVMPLIIAAMISGIAKLGDIRNLGSLGTRTLVYYIATTSLSVLTGIALVLLVQPGKTGLQSSRNSITQPEAIYRIEGNGIKLERGALPEGDPSTFSLHLLDRNISATITAAEHTDRSITLHTSGWKQRNDTVSIRSGTGKGVRFDPLAEQRFAKEQRSISEILKEMLLGLVPSNIFKAMAENDILPVITFSLLLGVALSMSGEAGKSALSFFNGLNEAMMKIIHLAMYASPIGIGALVAGRLGEAGGFNGFWPELQSLGSYALTVIGGLAIHSLVTIPLILKLFGKTSPRTFALNTAPALLAAFSTASSSATLPLTIECAEEKNGISPRTAGFVLPLGATVNMDGTALYEAVAVIFIAQMNGITLGLPELFIIFLTATLAAIGAAGIPEAGLVTMVIVLRAVNLPIEGIALILSIDWFLDRCRTAVNVWGDSAGAKIIDVKSPAS
ncbi:MAG: dicarboxylate/amino acid:cation symporter [Chlorobium sp.]|jgi:solute carrier family 1 (high affinity glutamate transporter) protein 1|uniref:dicarboxylate/amino acid:cation symporter n=1 Tax=Chlorobium sp. TaxID=1095 RepID=UPI001DF64845|nr:dicarboxylate/amino acid:cation symporter [Chlorobium sp.]MBN1279177.1 dicarboxylate/amino acid:cation symporter [Chlorobiaceae bacterium]MCF8216382.1 dicarboxylate/amino acid:cation symporter [Chlorobium sp.]MCF8271285.1 dicarboxylate/amino acid:cation symporter [Chlorobium sp.]MCF8287659.1 dicarboxylate/amino acid:cation symporter [Chlorobium sp.]MCF8291214.1 dicarboxylate/amino acid:cation symporter [Chlorobium sp.]